MEMRVSNRGARVVLYDGEAGGLDEEGARNGRVPGMASNELHLVEVITQNSSR
jgi:hypothetical protein